MKFNHLWTNFPMSSKAKLFWERITFSGITKFYFCFSLFHCCIQMVFQIQAFSINAQAGALLMSLVEQGNALQKGFAVMGSDGLRFCETVPSTFSTAKCQQVWMASSGSDTASHTLGSSNSIPLQISSSSSTTSSVDSVASVPDEPVTITTSVTQTTVVDGSTTTMPVSVETLVVAFGDQEDNANDVENEDELGADIDDSIIDALRSKRSTSAANSGVIEVSAIMVNGTTEVTINGLGWNDTQKNLTQRCLATLNWPLETIDNTKREDITFVAFQIWVLGMSVVALLNESMPHIIASLLTHILATAWAAFQIFQTAQFHTEFTRLTTDGACQINLLPGYWQDRSDAEIPSLALNAVALLLSCFLSWRLIKLFGWQTFKRIGASRTINRVYMLVLVLSIAIQLSLFFIIASIGLWIDQLYNGAVGQLATLSSVYKGVLITVLLLLIPWLTIGWIAVRRELRLPMLLFLVMSIGYLVGWGGMFASTTFRWTFVLWRFFSLITSASLFLTIVTFILGLLCRINFGKGLSRYLSAQEPIPDNTDPTAQGQYEYDDEKVEFPSGRDVPTFSAAFGRGDEVPPPSQMRFGPPRVGPRFTNPPAEPFDPQPAENLSRQTTYSKNAYSMDSTNGGFYNTTQLSRQLSAGSTTSSTSQKSSSSYKSNRTADSYRSDKSLTMNGSRSGNRNNRWVIE